MWRCVGRDHWFHCFVSAGIEVNTGKVPGNVSSAIGIWFADSEKGVSTFLLGGSNSLHQQKRL